MPKKAIKATNGKNKKAEKNDELITEDLIKMLNEAREEAKAEERKRQWEEQARKKRAYKKAKREAERKRRERKENIILGWLFLLTLVVIFILVGIIDYPIFG